MWRSLVGLEDVETETPTEEALRAAFDRLDEDSSGTLSREELKRRILKGWGGSETDETVSGMITWADLDADGAVSYGEFRSILLGSDDSS